MDLNASLDNESTAVIRMKRHFADFISDHRPVSVNDEPLGDKHCKRLDFSNLSDTSSFTAESPLEKERKLVSVQSELQLARSTISQLKTQLTNMESSRKRARCDVEAQLDIAKTEVQTEHRKYEELAIQFKFVKERCDRYADLLKGERENNQEKMNLLQSKVDTLLKEKQSNITEMHQERDKLQEKMSQLSSQVTQYQSESYSLRRQIGELTTQQAGEIRQKTQEFRSKCDDYRAKLLVSSHKVEELEDKLKRVEEDSKVGLLLKSQLASLPKLEREVAKLREDNALLRERSENILLFKEQRDGAEMKCKRLEERLAQASQLQVENEEMKKRIEELKRLSQSVQSPSALKKQVLELQNSEAMMLERVGVLQTSLHSVDQSLKSTSEQNNQLEVSCRKEQQKSQQQAELIKRLQRRLLLVTKERDGYKRIIDSYESEVTVSLDSQTNSRLQQQEQVIQAYRQQLEQAETDIQRLTADLSSCQAKCLEVEKQAPLSTVMDSLSRVDDKTILSLREKICTLESSLETVQREKEVLEARLEQRHLQGDYDPTTTKVIHFSHNPAALAQKAKAQELETLKEENERLRQRVKLLEETGGNVDDLTVMVEKNVRETASVDTQELRKQLETAEIKNNRLMEAFKKTSQDFRSSVYQLTGYQINIKPNNQFQLMSMYAESPDDVLLFQQGKTGNMQLLETDFSSTLTSHVDLYLKKRDSIPCFLSNVTLDLFSRQTIQLD